METQKEMPLLYAGASGHGEIWILRNQFGKRGNLGENK